MSTSVWIDAAGSVPAEVDAAERAVRSQGGHARIVDGRDTGALDTLLAEESADLILWLGAGATPAPGGLRTLERVVARFPADLYYSDSLDRPRAGAKAAIVHRPVLSPIRLRSQDYLGKVRAFGRDAVIAAGGFSAGDGSITGLTRRVAKGGNTVRIPEPLWLGLGDLPPAAEVVDYPIVGEPLVSILIPTRGTSATIGARERVLVLDAISGIRQKSTYRNLEFVVVADDATPQAVIDELAAMGPDVRLVRWSAPFSFSAKLNRGAAYARGEYLLLLNDDVELISPGWIEAMLGLLQQPGVGLVGAALFFEDGSVQHGGHLYQDLGAGHIAFHWAEGRDDALGSLAVDREVSGVTAACALVSAADYAAVGGFSALLPGNYNDVDFCLKIRSTGLSVVWTPRARLFHYESKTRIATVASSELKTLRQRWSPRLLVDSYWRE